MLRLHALLLPIPHWEHVFATLRDVIETEEHRQSARLATGSPGARGVAAGTGTQASALALVKTPNGYAHAALATIRKCIL